MKHLMSLRDGVDRGTVDGDELSTPQSGMPTRNTCAQGGWSHGCKDQMVILGKKHHTSSAMVGRIKFAKVQFFFKCVVVWIW
jgi:hypothetical protein